MSDQHNFDNLPCRLMLSETSNAESPPTVHCDTRLDETWADIAEHQYILATNDAGHIVGVVPSSRILKRLQSANDRERMRWEGMPLSALIHFSLGHAPADAPCVKLTKDQECVALAQNEELIGVSINGDLFFSWRRLEPTLASASCDPLTGLMNRLAYERRLNEEWSRSERSGTSVAVVVVDLDDFKGVNDQYGHQTGDDVLRNVASTLESSLRSYDVVARFGGDEFVALCLGCRPGDINIPITRIQQGFRDCTFDYEGGTKAVKCSIGAAVRHDDFTANQPAALFAAADNCLYQAKRFSGDPHVVEFGAGGNTQIRRLQDVDLSTISTNDSSLNEELAQ